MLNFKAIVGFLLLCLLVSCLGSESIKDSSKDQHDSIPEKNSSADHHESEHHSEHIHEDEAHNQQDKELDLKRTTELEEEPNESQKIQGESSRQFQPLYQPFFPQPSGFSMIRRQFGGGMDLLGDIVMMGMIGLPILGLLTVGSSSIANFLGFGSKPSSKRTRRSLKEKAAGAVEYARNLWDVMEQLERAFEKYDLYQAECRLLAVCEAHQKRLGAWGQTILDLMRKQKELEKEEILPVSRFIFSNYADAAQVGSRGGNCQQLFTGCPHHLFFSSDKENEIE